MAFVRVRSRMTAGIIVLVPLVVTLFVLRLLFDFTVGALLPVLGLAVEDWPWILQALLATGILLTGVYVLGLLASHVMGQRLINLGERVLLQVPLVRTVYRSSKQVVDAFRQNEARAFRSVVLVEFPGPGARAVGFVTGSVPRPDGSRWHTVFIPTTPNPTTGFLQLLPDSAVEHTSMSTEEAFKMIMSLGALAPAADRLQASSGVGPMPGDS